MATPKVNRPHKKVGNKKWTLTPKRIKTIKELAAKGCTQATIARQVGLAPNTFTTKKLEYPELNEIIEAARASGQSVAVGFLWDMVSNPNHPKHFSSLVFYLKTQHQWRDHGPIEADKDPSTGFQGYSIETIKKGVDSEEEIKEQRIEELEEEIKQLKSDGGEDNEHN